MSRIFVTLAFSAAALFAAVAMPSSAGPCDHLQPGTYAYAECMNEHGWG
ncbi:hypothetical protein OG875_14925 [Streptomyces sp. NBC_01498]|nr:hypothetical protein [Streptomyces sp. NBC_01498]WTL25778.1 hypothetical protein OG875_14925 [Streptomyces sp. NBC_01498]